MKLASPYALLLLALLPVLFYWARQRARAAAIAYPAVAELSALESSWAARLRRALPWLRWLALALIIAALARPQWGVEMTKIFRKGIAIAMVVDISSSMGAQDLQLGGTPLGGTPLGGTPLGQGESNRLDVVKQTFRDFVASGTDELDELSRREGDLIGMYTFARYSDALSPLTLDHAALLQLLEQVQIVALPEEDGTAIGDAIVSGVDGLRKAAGVSKVMILLTDGSNNAGDTHPLQAAQIAKALGIKIYTIGAGTRGVVMMPVKTSGGSVVMLPTQVYIDEDTLTAVAKLTGGQYFRATDSAALRSIYAEIDRLETADNVVENFQQYLEGFTPLALAALVLLLLEALLSNTYLRTVP